VGGSCAARRRLDPIVLGGEAGELGLEHGRARNKRDITVPIRDVQRVGDVLVLLALEIRR